MPNFLLPRARAQARCPRWVAGALLLALAAAPAARAQEGGWGASVGDDPSGGTTTIPRIETASGQVRLEAHLTADGQKIDKGLVWHVFRAGGEAGKKQLVGTYREPAPLLTLDAGDYVVNAAFGRANLTRKITVKPATVPATETFVINAGGLRVSALVNGAPAPANSVSYDILTDRDQTDARKVIMTGAKPGMIMRLNSGIYHVVSTYGDANATVASDVTVEAGKLTEAQIAHAAAKTTFKLVARAGGEAVADTQWSIQTREGRVVKENVGALPTHVLAPGTYIANAKSQGNVYQREFTVADGETKEVEVLMAAPLKP
jgi:hypothetical protein